MLRSVGSIIFGIAADRYGRKWPFIINNLLFIVLELVSSTPRLFDLNLFLLPSRHWIHSSFQPSNATRNLPRRISHVTSLGDTWRGLSKASQNLGNPAKGFVDKASLSYMTLYLYIACNYH
jgi:hypothetical protein